MSGIDHEHTDQIGIAASWLAEQPSWPQPVTKVLREMFGLGFLDAARAMAEAERIVRRRGNE